jgi:hypothetical protein
MNSTAQTFQAKHIRAERTTKADELSKFHPNTACLASSTCDYADIHTSKEPTAEHLQLSAELLPIHHYQNDSMIIMYTRLSASAQIPKEGVAYFPYL